MLTFEPADDIAAPYVSIGGRPRVAILRDQGVNGQTEMAAAFDRAGFDAVDVHMTDLVTGRVSLNSFPALAACGGFSYGDVLGGGGGWAKSILFNAELRAEFETFFARDTLALGICNGCQLMSQLRPLIPGAEQWPTFVRNRSDQFEARTVQVRIESTDSPWLEGMFGSQIPVPVAHGEGRPHFQRSTDYESLVLGRQIAARFVGVDSEPTEQYPHNPNGAIEGLAGLVAASGQALIMMPHPERVFRTVQNSWVEPNHVHREDGPWMRMFRNARVAIG